MEMNFKVVFNTVNSSYAGGLLPSEGFKAPLEYFVVATTTYAATKLLM